MTISTAHLERCLQTLDASLSMLLKENANSLHYEVFRNAVIKGFELTLEISGKLMRKFLKAYDSNPKSVDGLVYKEVLRHAAKHGLLDAQGVERWFNYRDNRNDTAHDYGEAFAEQTLALLPSFIADVRALVTALNRTPHA